MAPSANKDQTFSFELVACLLALSAPTVGAKHYALMESVEGATSKSGYDHRLRAVKIRAKEISDAMKHGDINVDATPVKQKAKTGTKSATPTGSKRKARSEMEAPAETTCDGEDYDDVEERKTPSKKAKKDTSEDADVLI